MSVNTAIEEMWEAQSCPWCGMSMESHDDDSDEQFAAREAWEYPTEEQAEQMRLDAEAQYEAQCAEQGIKSFHDETCDDDNPCAECRSDQHDEWIEERRYERR